MTTRGDIMELTDTERDAIENAWMISPKNGPSGDDDPMYRAVEAIVTPYADALARVEALAEDWERQAEDPGDPAYKIGLFSAAGEVRAALAGLSTEYHAGALYGIRHPGSRNGCPYCDATIAQRDRWAVAPSPDEVGK